MSSPTATIESTTTKLNTKKTIRSEFLKGIHPSHHRHHAQQQNQQLSSSSAYSTQSIFNSVVAGYLAGCTGTLVGHPLDSIKVLLQTQSSTPTFNANSNSAPTAANSSSVASSPSTTTTVSGPAASSSSSSLHGRPIAQTTTPAAASMSTMTRSPTSYELVATRAVGALTKIQNLYAGMTGPFLSLGVLQAFSFAIYDSSRRVLHRHSNPSASQYDYINNDSLLNVFIASTIAGTCTTIFTSPMMIIKTKQQIKLWGFRQAIRETLHASSTKSTSSISKLKNFYIGFGPHFVSNAIGKGIYMYVYEACKRKYVASSSATQSNDSNTITIKGRMACAAIAGMTCWASIYPFDVLQNQTYRQALLVNNNNNGDVTLRNNTTTTWQLARQMYNQGGIAAFFRGFGITVLRAGPVAAAVLPVYDMSLKWLTTTV
mmetsp:Transcript_10464/g.14823  ORF Transcript_10464/g.14823 Transcript_10464/m.14823 type:complete len:430 (+) Transcript_10464:163-1452(+)